MATNVSENKPHVLLFPCPGQGHIANFLNLAELLCLVDIDVTFLNTETSDRLLNQNSNVKERFAPYPGFRLAVISDVFDEDNMPLFEERLSKLMERMDNTTKPIFKKMLNDGSLVGDGRPQFTCVIIDGIIGFVIDVVQELRIPVITFYTQNAPAIWITFSIPEMLTTGQFPFQGEKDDKIYSIRGLEGIFRIKDFEAPPESEDHYQMEGIKLIGMAVLKAREADAFIFNSFEDLEGPALSQIRSKYQITYAPGPFHAHIKSRVALKNITKPSLPCGSGLLQPDTSCIAWLDSKPSRSVVYVSFGSTTTLEKDQFLEIWHGLVGSGDFFLWVMGPNNIRGEDSSEDQSSLLSELKEAAGGRAYVISWAPQEQVLSHPATGCFFTHGGWNSVLEAIVEGVPMICWPYFGDHFVDSRCVSDMYKVGLVMTDYGSDRDTISRIVNEVMITRKDEFLESSRVLADKTKVAVNEGGSSFNDLDKLADQIRSMQLTSAKK
ncbi:7-deoxyloganetic acid glucosyltransferase-like protein [Drosera capensis]